MKGHFYKIFLLFILINPTLTMASDSQFEVVKKISGCKYFVAEQGADYIVAEDWLCFVSKSSTGIGKLDGYGIKKVTLDGLECSLYVDDYLLSKSRALEKLLDKCD